MSLGCGASSEGPSIRVTGNRLWLFRARSRGSGLRVCGVNVGWFVGTVVAVVWFGLGFGGPGSGGAGVPVRRPPGRWVAGVGAVVAGSHARL